MMMDQAEKLRDMVQSKNVNILKQITSRVVTITSGKGGVGKSNFTVNLAVHFRRKGKKVTIIDADFGLANIELLFGLLPKYCLADVFSGEKKMEEIITEGPLGIKFVSGGSGLKELSNISERQIASVIENFKYLDSISDIILVDTGAGISKSVINFIKASNESIIVTTPEPTSIMDAYSLIKTVKEESAITPNLKVVVNRVENLQEGKIVFGKLNKAAKKFLGINLEYLESILYDNNLVKAVKLQTPVVIGFPNTAFSKSIESIGCKLLDIDTCGEKAEDLGIISFIKRLANIF